MAIKDIIRKSLERARSIPGKIGLRLYQVWLVQRICPYPQYGDPLQGLSITTIKTKLGSKDSAGNIQNPNIEEQNCRMLLASGGMYEYTLLSVGSFTKNYVVSSIPGGYFMTGLNPQPLTKIYGTTTLTKSSNTMTFPTTITGLVVGQGITISNAAHPSNNGVFQISSISTLYSTVSYTNAAGYAEAATYSISGTMEMNVEVVNSDDSHVDKYYISQINEYNLTHIDLQLTKITGDAG